jgi:hypothetical protein
MAFGRRGDLKVGDNVHKVGELVQQAGDMYSSSESKNRCGF